MFGLYLNTIHLRTSIERELERNEQVDLRRNIPRSGLPSRIRPLLEHADSLKKIHISLKFPPRLLQ